MPVGSTRIRLAKMLNRCIPEMENGTKIVWRPESIYPCRGFWRIRRKQMDVMSWEATAYHAVTGQVMWNGGCWETMTECLKAGEVHVYGSLRMDTIAPGPYVEPKPYTEEE